MLSRTNRRSGYGRYAVPKRRRGLITAAVASLVIAASGAMVACTGETFSGPLPPDEISAARGGNGSGGFDAKSIGRFHNEFLDFSFPRVLKAVAQGADEQKVCKVIAQAMRDFVVSRNIPRKVASIGDEIAGGKCATKGGNPKNGASFSLAGDGTPLADVDAVVAEMSYAIEAGYAIGDLAALFDQKVAYARANFPEAEAEVIASAASVGLSSVEYWDANYEAQAAQLLEAKSNGTYSLGEIGSPTIAAGRSVLARNLVAPPDRRHDYTWRSIARKVGVSDLAGAVKGGIKGWSGGLPGIGAGAMVEGGAASAGALIAAVLQ